MIPEGCEPLSFDDHILVARINLCCAAVALLVSVFLLELSDWPARTFALVAAAGLILLARQIEPILRRLQGPSHAHRRDDSLPIHYLFPF
jgi:hypothetical protein